MVMKGLCQIIHNFQLYHLWLKVVPWFQNKKKKIKQNNNNINETTFDTIIIKHKLKCSIKICTYKQIIKEIMGERINKEICIKQTLQNLNEKIQIKTTWKNEMITDRWKKSRSKAVSFTISCHTLSIRIIN